VRDTKEKTGSEAREDPLRDPLESIEGLSTQEASRRLKRYGYNEIEEREESWLHRLFRRFWGPIPWMIEVAAVLSAVARRWEDFTIIMIMLFVNALVDFYQESKALNAIAETGAQGACASRRRVEADRR